MKHCLSLWLLVLLLLHWPGAARATAGPPATGRSLAEALNPDGTLKKGAVGSFDARAFRMGTAPDGRPVFRPASTKGAGDERWADGFGLPDGVNGTVFAVVRAGNDLYVGGDFSIAGGVVASVAKWNGAAWSPLGAGSANGMDGTVSALAVAGNGDVYAGGRFTRAGGVAASNVAKWNGTAWSPLGAGPANGVDGGVYALAVAGNGDVYAGGGFTRAGGVAASNVAKWNGTAWSPLGAGPANGVDGYVFALAVAGNGDVYAGGGFTRAGGAAASRVAKWNGTAWSPLGTGTGGGVYSGAVYALAVAGNGDVYAGGGFGQAGGAAASRVAKWNGTAWSPLGTGFSGGLNDGAVFALAVAGNGDVYAGGGFGQAGGAAASNVAKWNGTAWSPLGTGSANGVDDYVFALAVAGNGDVYAGGRFTRAGGAAASRVAKWNNAAPLATAASRAVPAAQLYPNPAHGTATLRLPTGAPRLPLTLADALGRTVRRYPAPAGAEAVLDLRGLPAGTYVVRCGQLSQRLVVE
jgi:hypothetical protein